MQFIMFVATDSEPDTSEEPGLGIEEWFDEVNGAGKWVAGDRLRPAEDATTVRVRQGQRLLTDGPFADTAEWIAGYDILECADLNEAVEIASKHPNARTGRIEVRPVWPLDEA